MLKRTVIVLCMTLALVIAVEPLQTVHGILMTNAEWFAMNTTPAVNSVAKSSGGNGFVRALGAPFRAIGRLFGRGKKSEPKLERISEKDAQRFESTPAVQVSKSTPLDSNAAIAVAAAPDSSGFASGVEQDPAKVRAALADEHLEKGRALLNSHDLNGAIAQLSLAASANPKLSEASSLLGIAYWRKGLRDIAERSLTNAVQLNQNDPDNLNNLGFLLYENGDYEQATKYLKRAVKLSPTDARIWNNLGLVQSERGKFDDAYESFARAQGEFKGHLNVATRLEHQGAAKKAIKHLERALALQPNSPEVLARLISLYDTAGNEKQALAARASLESLRTLAKGK
jgi:Flp pilus assembly protein TadD